MKEKAYVTVSLSSLLIGFEHNRLENISILHLDEDVASISKQVNATQLGYSGYSA